MSDVDDLQFGARNRLVNMSLMGRYKLIDVGLDALTYFGCELVSIEAKGLTCQRTHLLIYN